MSSVGEYGRLSDDELLRRTATDREAFGELYDRHVRAVLGELRRRGLSTDEALDLTAEVFAAALVASRRYRPGEAPALAWLLGIARNKLAHGHRRTATETAARRKLGMDRLTYSDDALERVDELLDAERVYTNGTATLPPAEREAVVARVIEERGYDEIAAASGATPAAIRQRVSRGLAKLARLGREGE